MLLPAYYRQILDICCFFIISLLEIKIASFTHTKISLKFRILKNLYNFALQYGISKACQERLKNDLKFMPVIQEI